MKLPKAIYKKTKSTPIDIVFKGYNKNTVLTQGELSDCLNLSTNNYPTLSPRPSREITNTLGTANALFTANEVLCWVDGAIFKYGGVSKGSVTSGTKSMVEFNNHILIFPDKKKYDYVADSFSDIGSGTYPAAGSCPDMDIVVTHDNRVYGVKDNIIYWSARGNANDWTTFDATEEEAGAITISKVREFTGVVEYQQHIVFFTENETLEMYGSPPSLSIRDSFKKGCIDNKSIVEVNGLLYFLSQDGINIYGGGMPRLISDNLNEDAYISGVAGTDGKKYYISLYNGTGYKLFVYDTLNGIWLKEDTLRVVEFAYLDKYLYALAIDNKIYKFNSGAEVITSEAHTEIFTEIINQKKVYSKLIARIELETSASILVYIKVDNGSYELVGTYQTIGLRTIDVNFSPRRCDHFQVKFVGSGEYKIYNLERRYTKSGD